MCSLRTIQRSPQSIPKPPVSDENLFPLSVRFAEMMKTPDPKKNYCPELLRGVWWMKDPFLVVSHTGRAELGRSPGKCLMFFLLWPCLAS